MKQEVKIIDNSEVDNLYNDIKLLVEESRNRVYKIVNTEMINLYWNIGKMIVDMQVGNEKAKYGEYLIKELSIRLTNKFGKGFSMPSLKRMRQFYNCFPIGSTLLNQLTWSHYLELIKINDKNETIVKYTLPEDNQTIFSSEFRLTIPSEKEFISVIENEKKNLELIY